MTLVASILRLGTLILLTSGIILLQNTLIKILLAFGIKITDAIRSASHFILYVYTLYATTMFEFFGCARMRETKKERRTCYDFMIFKYKSITIIMFSTTIQMQFKWNKSPIEYISMCKCECVCNDTSTASSRPQH